MGQPVKINSFHKDLEYSLSERVDDMFTRFYKKFFPNIEKIELVEDLETQKKGIDRIITYNNGCIVTIDEKLRRTKYNDILLEKWSIWREKNNNNKLGWLFTSQCDYIAYAIESKNVVYMLPVLLLRKAWQSNKNKWVRYREIKAINEGYITRSIAIPTKELLISIQNEFAQTFII